MASLSPQASSSRLGFFMVSLFGALQNCSKRFDCLDKPQSGCCTLGGEGIPFMLGDFGISLPGIYIVFSLCWDEPLFIFFFARIPSVFP